MKRSLQALTVFVFLAGFYLASYYFSGVKRTPVGPTGRTLYMFGIPLPSTPAVYSAYNKFYWPLLLYTARQKPPRLVTGVIRKLDFSQRYLVVESSATQGVGCRFTSAHDSTLKAFKQGDVVSVSVGYVPHPTFPGSFSYTLLSITAKE